MVVGVVRAAETPVSILTGRGGGGGGGVVMRVVRAAETPVSILTGRGGKIHKISTSR